MRSSRLSMASLATPRRRLAAVRVLATVLAQATVRVLAMVPVLALARVPAANRILALALAPGCLAVSKEIVRRPGEAPADDRL